MSALVALKLSLNPTDTYWVRKEEVSKSNQEFHASSQLFSDDPDIDRLREETQRFYEEIIIKAADTCRRESTPRPTLTGESSTPVRTPSNLILDLPTFSGNPLDWENFKSMFTSAMDNAGAHLSNSERCCHLLKSMTDDKLWRQPTVTGTTTNKSWRNSKVSSEVLLCGVYEEVPHPLH